MRDPSQDLRAKILGRRGENAVCRYLKREGYRILERNYKTPFGEADIVALRGGIYAFVEVKTRSSDEYGSPGEGVTAAKRKRYRAIAQYFCLSKGEELPVRFDVAALTEQGLEYIENAF